MYTPGKRKRRYAPIYRNNRFKKSRNMAVAPRRPRFRSGYDRTGGFYGRFSRGRGELKFLDTDITNAGIASTGEITSSVNLIPQGVTESTRVGRKCTIRAIGARWSVSCLGTDSQSTLAGAVVVRIIFFLDKQANGAAASVADILESADCFSYRNLANTTRFRILYDKRISLNHSGAASDAANQFSAGETARQMDFYKKCNIPIEFDSTTGAITEIKSNNIGILMISEDNNQAALAGTCRIRFSDD